MNEVFTVKARLKRMEDGLRALEIEVQKLKAQAPLVPFAAEPLAPPRRPLNYSDDK